MTQPLQIRGLPTSLARDGWWLDAEPPHDPAVQGRSTTARLPPVLGLLLLVLLADLLFWHHSLGLSVAVFAVSVFAVATMINPPSHALWRPSLVLMIAIAPVVDQVQMLSIGFLGMGLAFALVCARRPDASITTLSALAAALLRCLSLDLRARLCRVDKTEVALTAMEFDLLSRLMAEPNRLYSRGMLIAALWGAQSAVSDRTLDSHLRNLRRKLAEAGCEGAIETVHGQGIRLSPCA